MKIIKPSYEILTPIDGNAILKLLEVAGRTCYKSEDRITEDSALNFCNLILSLNHESVIEHFSVTVRFICNRGFSHELVRHRLSSFSQESTRYCNYSKDKFGQEISVIRPANFENWDIYLQGQWCDSMRSAEKSYFRMLNFGARPEDARGVLPIDVKTEIVHTANLREWRHILKLRTSKAAHPSMRELMIPLLKEFQNKIPKLFDDIGV